MNAEKTRRRLLVLTGLLAAGFLLTARQETRLRWRAQLIVNKSVGSLSGVQWSHVFAGILPHKVRDVIGFEALHVSAEKKGPNPCSVLWRTHLGGFWGRPGDAHSLEMALKYRLYDEFYLRGEASVRKGDTVIDAGAHLGTFTAYALKQGARRVILFEPHPVNAACLRQTFLTDADTGKVVILEEAVWHERGVLSFHEMSDSLQGFISNGPSPDGTTGARIMVRVTTIDDAIEKLTLDRVDVIKLNVEGAERNALRGARQTIRRFRPRIVVNLEHRTDDAEAIPAFVLGLIPDYQIRLRGREQAFIY